MDYKIPSYMKKKYTNPIPVTNNGNLKDKQIVVNGDPFVMKYNGEYYCYSSGVDGVNLLHSLDMVHFEHMGFCLQEEGAFSYWAPCVIYDNGRFYMYYSTNPIGEYDDHAHCLKLAVSDSPYGPFTYVKQFFDNFSIDPHVVKDSRGEYYIFYSVNDYSGTDRNFAGTVIVADRLLNFGQLEGKPFPVIMPSIKEEVFAENRFGDGRDWHTIEGAFYLEKGNNAYIMYSANCFVNPTYFIGYARAAKEGTIADYRWRKYPDDHTYEPFIHQNGQVGGTGHNSVVKAPNNVDDWIVYHGHEQIPGREDLVEHRAMRIDPIIWGKDKMYTPAPSSEVQDAPAEPYYRNLYHEKTDREIMVDGEWSVKDNCLAQTSNHGITSMYLDNVSLENYLYEISARWIKYHFGGRYGVFAAYVDTQNHVQVILNEGEKCLEMFAALDGSFSEVKKVPVNGRFDFKAFHKLSVKRTGHYFQVYLDDVEMFSAIYEIGRSTVGIVNYYTAAMYDSVELTEYLELNKDNASGFISQAKARQDSLEKNWAVEKGKLVNYAVDSEMLLLKPALAHYRFSACMEQIFCRENTYCGIYAAYFDEENYIQAMIYQMERKIVICEKKNGHMEEKEVIPEEKELSALTVKRYGDKIAILLGRQVLDERVLERQDPSRCGLCSDVRTVFDGIELLGL